MKRKVRTITVNQQKFVWWYSIGEHETVVKLSPFADKTSVINVVFGDIEESLYGEYNESVVISRESVPQCGLFQYNEDITLLDVDPRCSVTLVKSWTNPEYQFTIIEPKMAALLLTYFTEQNDMFETRKNITLNGYDLLTQMGYQILEVKKGMCW